MQKNLFEKLLPCAIAFNMTKKWIKKVENIRGDDYFKGYSPLWYSGAINSFNANSLTSTINGISQQISSSSSSGGGGSGGGGGGGGGGGW